MQQMNREQLINEIKRVNKEIKSFNMTNDERKKERLILTNDYNEVKEQALKTIGLVAECDGKSIPKILNERKAEFDKS